MRLFDYALDTDGEKAAAAKRDAEDREWQEQYDAQLRNKQALTGIQLQAQAEADPWQHHLEAEANRIKPREDTAYFVQNDNKPVDIGGFAHAVGTHVAIVGTNVMVNNPAKALLGFGGDELGIHRVHKGQEMRLYIFANVFV